MSMAKKLLVKSKVSREHYKADACVVWCFDDRFTPTRRRFFKKLGLQRIDRVIIAGGAKVLAVAESTFDKKFVLGQITTSIRLHHTKHVILVTHSDCGAYGGLAAFGNDSVKELAAHARDQKRAGGAGEKKRPRGAPAEAVFVDFEGVWRI